MIGAEGMMLKRAIFFVLITNLLFSVTHAMESEDKLGYLHPKSKKRELKSYYEEDQESWAIEDFCWRMNGKLDDSIVKSQALFYRKCANQLVIGAGLSGDDLNCGLPQEIAQPFLELCLQLTKKLRSRADQMCVIQEVASLNKAQVTTLVGRVGNSNNPYLTLWHRLVPETMPVQSCYKIIPLLLQIKKSNIDELLGLNILLGDMKGVQLVKLVKIFTTLSAKEHFCRVKNCQKFFEKHPNMSVKERLKFLQQLAKL